MKSIAVEIRGSKYNAQTKQLQIDLVTLMPKAVMDRTLSKVTLYVDPPAARLMNFHERPM